MRTHALCSWLMCSLSEPLTVLHLGFGNPFAHMPECIAVRSQLPGRIVESHTPCSHNSLMLTGTTLQVVLLGLYVGDAAHFALRKTANGLRPSWRSLH